MQADPPSKPDENTFNAFDAFSCMDAVFESMFMMDQQLHFIKGNQAFHAFIAAVTGGNLLKGQSVMDAGIPEQIIKSWQNGFDMDIKQKKATLIEVEITVLSEPTHVEYSFNPVYSESLDLGSILVIGRDITAVFGIGI